MALGPEWDPDEALKALEMEHRVHGDTESNAVTSQRIMEENVVGATLSIVHLALYGESEQMRFNAGKYVFERVHGRVTEEGFNMGETDPFNKFLKSLEAASAPEADK
jgi:hypothetical protein